MIIKIPILLILLLVESFNANPLPEDSTTTLNTQDSEKIESSDENKNETESKNSENTVNLNMNRGGKRNHPNELESIIEQQKNIQELLSNAYQSKKSKPVNFFNPQEIIRLREQRLLNNQQEYDPHEQKQDLQPLSSTGNTEKIRNLQSKELTPLEKIFNSISRSNFRVRGLVIINNNNNNNNVDEDKFTIEEIIKLLEKKDYIGYQDIVEYDQTRRLRALKAKQSKDEAIRPLKGEAPAGEATQILNEENKSEQTVNADESKTNTDQTANAQNPDNIVNNNHEKDPLTSINMLKGKAEKVKPLQFEFVATNKGGMIIINNKNNNNNEKTKGAYSYSEPVNISNSNEGVQLPMDKLSKKDIDQIVETSIIVNNDNNNNNIT